MRGTKNPAHPLTEASFHNPSDSARSARRTRAFSVDRIDISDNSAVAPLQSTPPEIRRSEGGLAAAARPTDTKDFLAAHLDRHRTERRHGAVEKQLAGIACADRRRGVGLRNRHGTY